MKIRYYTKIPAAVLLCIVLAFYSCDGSTQPTQQTAGSLKPVRITQVNDGDTVSIRYKTAPVGTSKTERVRLVGIDAPELKQDPWGRASARHLKELISKNDWIVYLELDIEQRDKYGRLLGYLWSKDKQLINEKMILDGYAVAYTIPPNVKYAERFIEAQKSARTRKTGIWSKNGLKQNPSDWRRDHPGH
jgi:micrococcal nuclease